MGEAILAVGASNGWGPTPLTQEELDSVLDELIQDMDRASADVTILRPRTDSPKGNLQFSSASPSAYIIVLFLVKDEDKQSHSFNDLPLLRQQFWQAINLSQDVCISFPHWPCLESWVTFFTLSSACLFIMSSMASKSSFAVIKPMMIESQWVNDDVETLLVGSRVDGGCVGETAGDGLPHGGEGGHHRERGQWEVHPGGGPHPCHAGWWPRSSACQSLQAWPWGRNWKNLLNWPAQPLCELSFHHPVTTPIYSFLPCELGTLKHSSPRCLQIVSKP